MKLLDRMDTFDSIVFVYILSLCIMLQIILCFVPFQPNAGSGFAPQNYANQQESPQQMQQYTPSQPFTQPTQILYQVPPEGPDRKVIEGRCYYFNMVFSHFILSVKQDYNVFLHTLAFDDITGQDISGHNNRTDVLSYS